MSIDFKGRNYISDFMDRIPEAGHSIRIIDNVMYVSDVRAVQEMVDAYTISDAIKPLIAAIKAAARDRIVEILPDWKQSNYNARMNELNDIRFGRSLTAQEEAEVTAMRAVWQVAKDIRSASNDHEARINKLTTFESVAGYDIGSDWPA